MSKSNAASLSKPQVPALALTPAPAKASAVVQTPSGTLSITLAPAPTPNVPLYQNVSLWAGVIAFLGVVLTLIAAERRTKKELLASEKRMALERQFNSERAHQERITNTRRTVYLDLIDELSKAQQFIGSLANAKEPPDARSGLDGLSVAVSKISLVGEMETLVMARELSVLVNQSIVKAVPMSLQATIQRAVQDQHSKLCKAVREEIARLEIEIANRKKTSNGDATTLRELQAALDNAREKSISYGSGLMEATQVLLNLQMSYVNMTAAEANKLNRKLDDLIYAIRTELGLETSLERLRQSTSASEEANAATTDDLTAFGSALVQAATNIVYPSGTTPAEQNQ